jgi:hypothetical protein
MCLDSQACGDIPGRNCGLDTPNLLRLTRQWPLAYSQQTYSLGILNFVFTPQIESKVCLVKSRKRSNRSGEHDLILRMAI